MIKNVIVETKPRKIVWITTKDDWEQLFLIVKYNCWILGGYYNLIVGIDDKGEICESDKKLISSYDPDIIILPKGMEKIDFNISNINPYDIVEWDYLREYIDYYDGGIGNFECKRVSKKLLKNINPRLKEEKVLVYSSEELNQEQNKYAYFVCGDVFEYGHIDDEELSYREEFLIDALKDELYYNNFEILSREKLKESYETSIKDNNKFPNKNIALSLLKNIQTQFRIPSIRTFINTTISYGHSYAGYNEHKKGLKIIVSDTFGFDEALLFWNLRANGEYVHWISNNDLKNNISDLSEVLIKLVTNVEYETFRKNITIFRNNNNLDLRELLNNLKQANIEFMLNKYDDFNEFDYELPFIEESHNIISKNKDNYEIVINGEEYAGTCIVKIKSSDFIFPYNKNIDKMLSNDAIECYKDDYTSPHEVRFLRITKDNCISLQYCGGGTVYNFNDIYLKKCFDTILNDAGYSNLELSSTGRYHKKYIRLSGGFTQALKYLTTEPYKQLFSTLSDNKAQQKPGWILKEIDRRVLNMFEIFKLFKIEEPKNYRELYRKIDYIPKEIKELQQKSILQRGFYLTCDYCSFNNWCFVEEVGQTFRCKRCNEEQVYDINPLWLYKLNEVVYQGLVSDMEVPFLTINYLEKISKKKFDWVFDSDIVNKSTGQKNNLDIICVIDGKLCLGEVKKPDYIEKEQFDFYRTLCKKVKIDIIIFATMSNSWNNATQQLIDGLKSEFDGEVMILTKKELLTFI